MKWLALILAFGLYASSQGQALANSEIIKSHLTILTKTDHFRTHENVEQLNKTAAYIESVFNTYTDSTAFQEYKVLGLTYKNVIGSFGTNNSQ